MTPSWFSTAFARTSSYCVVSPSTEIVNKSINQTLSRTILTSGLTFLTVLSLYLFGGEVLRGFSLALVIGILIGTYSSIADCRSDAGGLSELA